jgi:hypothetical protein
MYSVDWFLWLDFYVFDPLRKSKMRALLRAFLSPLIGLHNRFVSFKTDVDFQLKVNSQVCKLAWGLNERFDSILRRIRIIDNANNQIDYIFLDSENRPLYLPNFLGSNEYEFEVRCPLSLKGVEKDIKAFLNIYKLPSKRYIITYE